jgi:hypothetical protein
MMKRIILFIVLLSGFQISFAQDYPHKVATGRIKPALDGSQSTSWQDTHGYLYTDHANAVLIQGMPADTTTPSQGNYLIYDTTKHKWSPENNPIRTDYQQMIGIKGVVYESSGTWTATKIATGNYTLRKSANADTVIYTIDITEEIRTTSGKGFELTSMDLIYGINTSAVTIDTANLYKISYTDSAAATISLDTLTGSLVKAFSTLPHKNTLTIKHPAYDNTGDMRYFLEVQVGNSAGTNTYDYYGLMLKFTKNGN